MRQQTWRMAERQMEVSRGTWEEKEMHRDGKSTTQLKRRRDILL